MKKSLLICSALLCYSSVAFAHYEQEPVGIASRGSSVEKKSSTMLEDFVAFFKGVTVGPDGSFTSKNDNTKILGKLSCSVADMEQKKKEIQAQVMSENFQPLVVQQKMRELFQCASISSISDLEATFSGTLKYPVCEDGSKIVAHATNQKSQLTCHVLGNVQKFQSYAKTLSGENLSKLSIQYDIDKFQDFIELATLLDELEKKPESSTVLKNRQKVTDLMDQLSGPIISSLHLLEGVLYRDNDHPLVTIKGDESNNYDINAYSSQQNNTLSLTWHDSDIRLKLSFPQSGKPALYVQLNPPQNIAEKLKGIAEDKDNPFARAVEGIAGTVLNATVYDVDSKPFIQLDAKLKNSIQINSQTPPKMEQVLDNFKVSILHQPTPLCQIKSVNFTASKPGVFTVCTATGCTDEQPNVAQNKLSSCMMEVRPTFEKFYNEVTQEANLINWQKYIPNYPQEDMLADDEEIEFVD